MQGGTQSTRSGRRTRGPATVVAALLSTLLFSVLPAQAGEKYYEGDIIGSSGFIEMVVVRDHGKVTVEHFHADDLDCPEGTGEANFGIRSINVDEKGRFDETKDFGGHGRSHHYATVRGRLRPGGRAKGTVLYHGSFDGVGICDTGTRKWKAQR